jgi:hypothetical protein
LLAPANETVNVKVPLDLGENKFTLTLYDLGGNKTTKEVTITRKDIKAPVLTVNEVTDKTTKVTGKTEPGAKVAVKLSGKTLGTATGAANGTFSIGIKAQKAGSELIISAADAAKNVTEKKVKVKDATAPTFTVNTVTNTSKEVTGKTEKGAVITVTIGKSKYKATASSSGTFKVKIPQQKAGTKLTVNAKDAAGNVSASKTLTVADKIAPGAPKVNTVKSTTTHVTGKTEAYATITIKIGKTVIGTAKADKHGNFKVTIKKQKKNTVLSVTAQDAAKNTSKATAVKVH